MISEGSAFLDRSGRVVVSDATFRALLGLNSGDASEALRQRAHAEAALASLLAGQGPDAVRLSAAGNAPACELRRISSSDGTLLQVIPSDGALPAPALELAIEAIALARLAGTVAHEVKNPLNAMALQLALLGDKIGSSSDSLAAACAGNLASLKNQIDRINEVIRRYLEIADPAPSGGFDAGGLLADAAHVFGHEARRRRVILTSESAAGVRAAGDPVRAARLLLGIFWRAISATPEGGRLVARAVASGSEAVLMIEHAEGPEDPALAWIGEVAAAGAAGMGGRLEESSRDGFVRAALVLPKERPL
jgi:signal transduction histidine kinase